MRRLGLFLTAWIVLLWTNPSLNADGTVCDDLAYIHILATHAASGQSHHMYYPLWYIPDDGSGVDVRPPFGEIDTVYHSHPGQPDSLRFTLPRATSPYDWWRITFFMGDFAGNESDSSNTISVTAPEE